jgi:hypothetical protein
MKKWQVADLEIDVDAVLRGQGADPEVIRQRSPRLIEIAEDALGIALDRLEPQVLVEEYEITGFSHDKLELINGKDLKGPLISGHLAGAKFVTIALCTVGSSIDELAAEIMEDDIVKGLAVDGVGSAAVEALANAVCREIEINAAAKGMETTIPLSPGMIGWGVEDGQPLIFNLADPSKHNIELTPHFLMVPRKSLSMIMGIGPNISSGARICDFCAMRETCRYQDHYEKSLG